MRTNGPGQSSLLLLDVIDVLNKFHIPYAIVGAFAASYYGVIRASVDTDAVISLCNKTSIVEQLVSELEKFFHKVSHRHGDIHDPVGYVLNIEDRFHNRVDLLAGLKGMREEAFAAVTESAFMGAKIRIVGIEDFIAMKIFAGGPKDIEDVRGVLKISSPKINLPLLKDVSAQYGRDVVKKLEVLLQESAQH